MVLTISGYDPNQNLFGRVTMAGTLWQEGITPALLAGPPCTLELSVSCENLIVYADSDCMANNSSEGFDAVGAGLPQAVHGKWIARMEQNGDVDTASFRFAEVCEVEFVPEPGSILLLGSGLAGLAGYATLRWRARE